MWKILAAASDFQRCVDRNQLFKWEEIRERHKASGYGEAFTSRVQKHMNKKAAPDELLKTMWKAVVPRMEVLRPGWQEFLKKNLQALYGSAEASGVSPTSVYSQNRADFEKAYPDWNIQEEQLLVYWIYTYFCGAVYDGEVFAKVKNGCGLHPADP